MRPPGGSQTRPSSERLRQAIFNVLRHYRWPESTNIIDQSTVVDLFAGTGAWGIEALSNGASAAWFVESHPLALKSLQANLTIASRCYESQRLEVPEIHLVRRDAAVAYRKLPSTRLLFCDPPYDSGWFEKVLQFEAEHGRIVSNGLLIYEAREKEALPGETPTLRLFDTKIYGDSAVHFFVKL